MTRSAAERMELAAQIALLAAPKLSPPTMVRLLMAYGSAVHAVRNLVNECGAEVAAAVQTEQFRARVRHLLGVVEAENIHAVAVTDSLYPDRVRQRLDAQAPPVLFARGRLEVLDVVGVAVVGSRRATHYGLDIASEVASGVARADGCVVSGLALGIDAAAHEAALRAGGATIGVLGCGIDVHYPRRNMHVQDRIAREALLLSEFLPGTPPLKRHFTHRNRVIAALSEAIVIVEAGERSGAVSTGTHGAALGVRVFGVMNAMHLPQVQGIIALLRDGAEVYTGLRDLLETTGLIGIGDSLPAAISTGKPPDRHVAMWALLGSEARHVNELASSLGIPLADALAALLELELQGSAEQLAGQYFVRVR